MPRIAVRGAGARRRKFHIQSAHAFCHTVPKKRNRRVFWRDCRDNPVFCHRFDFLYGNSGFPDPTILIFGYSVNQHTDIMRLCIPHADPFFCKKLPLHIAAVDGISKIRIGHCCIPIKIYVHIFASRHFKINCASIRTCKIILFAINVLFKPTAGLPKISAGIFITDFIRRRMVHIFHSHRTDICLLLILCDNACRPFCFCR